MNRPRFTKAQRLLVFETYGAIVLCQGCGAPMYIKGADIDHELAVINGGAHELENWRPYCDVCHPPKSALEHRENARSKRIAKKHNGPRQPARNWPSTKLGSRPMQSRKQTPHDRGNLHAGFFGGTVAVQPRECAQAHPLGNA